MSNISKKTARTKRRTKAAAAATTSLFYPQLSLYFVLFSLFLFWAVIVVAASSLYRCLFHFAPFVRSSSFGCSFTYYILFFSFFLVFIYVRTICRRSVGRSVGRSVSFGIFCSFHDLTKQQGNSSSSKNDDGKKKKYEEIIYEIVGEKCLYHGLELCGMCVCCTAATSSSFLRLNRRLQLLPYSSCGTCNIEVVDSDATNYTNCATKDSQMHPESNVKLMVGTFAFQMLFRFYFHVKHIATIVNSRLRVSLWSEGSHTVRESKCNGND